jgi:hypothetical protein
MKQKITESLNDPETLEQLFRENRREFARDFQDAAGTNDSELIRFWKIRLAQESGASTKIFIPDLIAVIVISLITAILVKIPSVFTAIHEESFLIRNLAIIAFNGLIIYTFREKKISAKWQMMYGIVILALLLYVNLLPCSESESVNIVFIHVPLFLWCIFGIVYISFDFRDVTGKIGFIRFNGELITMTGLLLITGGILTAVTLGLFSAIGLKIEKTYFEYIVLPGATVAPILAAFLVMLYPDITRKIVPVIAHVFTPVVLATLLVYMVSLPFSKIQILQDRDLLIVFNVMLLAVLAVIVFSVTELDKTQNKNFNVMILLLLAIVTLVINSVALTAIITRLTYGITPNRIVVFTTNVLVFVNLILIAKDLFRSYYNAGKLDSVERTLARYLTVYFLWTAFAIFLLPLIFGFI